MLTRASSWSSLETEIQNERSESQKVSRFNERYDPIIEADEVYETSQEGCTGVTSNIEGNLQAARNGLDWSTLMP